MRLLTVRYRIRFDAYARIYVPESQTTFWRWTFSWQMYWYPYPDGEKVEYDSLEEALVFLERETRQPRHQLSIVYLI
jgi:hypothetical protein